MGEINFPAYLSLFMLIIGVLGVIAGAAFYLKFTATKSNMEGKDETIDTLKGNRDEWKNKAGELEKEVKALRDEKAGLQGENKTLREIATQTPEILELTKIVTKSIDVQNQSIKQQGIVAKNIGQLTSEVKKLVEQERKGKKSNG